jgi:hypothetical protein
MADYKAWLELIPEHMRGSVTRWIEMGFPAPKLMGRFLQAVLTNDLMNSFAYADDENRAGMRGWVMFLHNYAPSGCYGSKEKLDAWHAAGDSRG